MAVARTHRHAGVGTAIVDTLVADLCKRGFALALVMTAAPSPQPRSTPDAYDATRRFWTARGFLPPVELDIWEANTVLLLVRPLAV